ncbi:hypothetical protein GCM10023336_77400 [Streptomyces similanensis]|uniref:Uncharacterized protein n=1 Tax=Streptomyces similanensis TaxID=1274988 RepID=A0ABP9LTH4_9ACTN
MKIALARPRTAPGTGYRAAHTVVTHGPALLGHVSRSGDPAPEVYRDGVTGLPRGLRLVYPPEVYESDGGSGLSG